MPSLICTPRKVFEKKVRVMFVGRWVDLLMLRYISLLLFIGLAWGQGAGDALDFDGSNDYVSINDNSSLTSTSAITISAWFKKCPALAG